MMTWEIYMMTVDDSGDKAGFIAIPTIVHTVQVYSTV